jgi:TatD DNase family protein
MIVDSHAHLDDPRFGAERAEVIQRAWDAGVRCILTIGNGSGPDDMACGIPIAEQHDGIYTSAGIHPHDAARAEDRHFAAMEELAMHPRVVAIGETGLDYHYDNSPREMQREVFRRQLEVAGALDLPVIVHTREADEDTERILRQVGNKRGVLHCFTSGIRLAEAALEMGFLISFSGIVTFPKSGSLREIAQRIPDERLLIETDCPYLAPAPHRGKRNEPAFVVETLRFLASARSVSEQELAAGTTRNFARLFGLGGNVLESSRREGK